MEINKPVATIIIVVITLILVFLFLIPKYRESVALNLELAQKQAEFDNQAVYHSNLSQAVQGIEKRKEEIEKIDSALPPEFSLSEVINFLEKKGNETGMIVKSVGFANGSKPPANVNGGESVREVKDVSFDLQLAGNYAGLKNFIFALENSARLFEVDSIGFSSQSQGITNLKNTFDTYGFKMRLTTHTY